MASYFYRAGRRVPVTIARSARVAQASDERWELTGWDVRELAPGLALLLAHQADYVREYENRDVQQDLEALSRDLLLWEGSHDRELRQLLEGEAALEARPERLTFPVVISAATSTVLFSVGDVVAAFKADVSEETVAARAARQGWQIRRRVHYLDRGYVFAPATQRDPLEFANALYEEQGARLAHPVFLEPLSERSGPRPTGWLTERLDRPVQSGDLAQRQWHLYNRGRNGAKAGVDVGARAAWNYCQGDPRIRVAIIDSGVESTHECFSDQGKVRPGYDFDEKDAVPEPRASSHGTACAALAGAGPRRGLVIGVAPTCALIPVRRSPVSDHLSIADALAWTVDAGADVISCSWGIDGRAWLLPDIVHEALVYATQRGRGGLGVPVFWAAGNGDEPVSDDEWASSPMTIAVAASTDQGLRASYSDFGPEIDLCAPSSGGANGITTAVNGGYTQGFGGTSAAAPIAAGVAALTLSLAPHLTWLEVRELLRSSARKLSPETGRYSIAGHSAYFGYGQVSAPSALLAIDVKTEVLRATQTAPLELQLDAFRDLIEKRVGGRQLLDFLRAKRLRLLAKLSSDASFASAVGVAVRAIAELGRRGSEGEEMVITQEAIEQVLVVARALLEGGAPDAVPYDG